MPSRVLVDVLSIELHARTPVPTSRSIHVHRSVRLICTSAARHTAIAQRSHWECRPPHGATEQSDAISTPMRMFGDPSGMCHHEPRRPLHRRSPVSAAANTNRGNVHLISRRALKQRNSPRTPFSSLPSRRPYVMNRVKRFSDAEDQHRSYSWTSLDVNTVRSPRWRSPRNVFGCPPR